MNPSTKKKFSSRTAKHLLDIGAIHVNVNKPYIFTSGWASPVYIDCRKIISFLEPRRDIIRMACEALTEANIVTSVDYIVGGETAGISYAAWISEALNKPMLYVRKKPKGFGRNAQIEGEMKEGSRVLLVEDLTTDGTSKVAFAKALRDGGATITDTFSIFFYGIYKESPQLLSNAGLTLHSLTTWKDVLDVAQDKNLFSEITFKEVENFLSAPAEWSRDHGGIYERASTSS